MKKMNRNYVIVAEKQDAEISFFPLLFRFFSPGFLHYMERNRIRHSGRIQRDDTDRETETGYREMIQTERQRQDTER